MSIAAAQAGDKRPLQGQTEKEEQTVSKEEKMMVLQMVAEGKITPEQGAELLRAIGETKPEAPAAPKPGWIPAAPSAPAAPPAPQAPAAPVAPRAPGQEIRDSIRRSIDANVRSNIEQSIERAARQAEKAAEMAASQAEAWAGRVAHHAEEFAETASREGENLGKVLGESGENIGKMIARLFSGGFGVGGPEFEFHEELRGELPAEGELQVQMSTSNGRVVVDTWDEQGFRLDIRKTAHAASEAEAKELVKDGYEFSQNGLSLNARTKEISTFVNAAYSVGFTLTLPRDRKASLQIRSSNGRLEVDRISGTSLKATTANGRIIVNGCSFSRTDTETANGRIEFSGNPGDLHASTANGRIEAELGGAGAWKMESANGRIEASITRAPGVAYEVDASTLAGKIEVTGLEDAEVLVDETKAKFGSRHYKARTRGFSDAASKASLVASTTSGRVTVSL